MILRTLLILLLLLLGVCCSLTLRVYHNHKTGLYPKWFTWTFMIVFVVLGIAGSIVTLL